MPSFLQQIFGAKPESSFLLLWDLKDKFSRFYTSIAEADAYVEKVKWRDTYVGVGLSPEDYGRGLRCESEHILGIPGLWIDLDVIGPAHKKQNLPPTIEAAQEFLASIPLKPTLVVHSGHGLQAWWLFPEIWIFKDAKEREEAESLSRRWTNSVRGWAQRRGWDVDSTWDLARILRVPGTTNAKVHKTPVPVTLLKDDGPRANPSDFEEWLTDDVTVNHVRAAAKAMEGQLHLNPEAQPPFDKWQALLANSAEFKRTWERKKKFADQSASSYDLSLANHGVLAGWSDQEIADLILAWRRLQGEDLKLRQDYYARTIAKARADVNANRSAEVIEDRVNLEIDNGPVGPEKRQAVLDELSRRLRFRIEGIVEYLSKEHDPRYYLVTPEGRHLIGGSETLNDQRAWRNRTTPVTHVPTSDFSKGAWVAIRALLWGIVVREQDVSSTESWLRDYLSEYPPRDGASEATISVKKPYIEGGRLYFFIEDFQHWLKLDRGENLSSQQIGQRVRNIGGEREFAHLEAYGRRVSRRVWRLPLPPFLPRPDQENRAE